MGLVILVLIFFAFRAGFTAISYVLTLVSLCLCATGGVALVYALAFVPLYFIHVIRMRHPLYVPPGLGRTGLVPVFGLIGLVLSTVVLVKVTKAMGILPVGAGLGVLLAIVALTQKMRARKEKRMYALFNTELGAQYCDLLQRMGAVSSRPASSEEKVDLLAALIAEREAIHAKIIAAGVNPAQFSGLLIAKAAWGEFPTVVSNHGGQGA